MKNIFKIFSIIFLIFTLLLISACGNFTGKDCTYLGEKIILLNRYEITVTDIETIENSVFILKNKEDIEKNEIYKSDKNFIKITLNIKYQNSEEYTNYEFDLNDFKLKDHTGIQIGNTQFLSSKDKAALSKKDFPTIKPIEDYTWVNSEISPGDEKEIILYFEIDEDFYIENILMILEIDFSGKPNNGEDIVLALRNEELEK